MNSVSHHSLTFTILSANRLVHIVVHMRQTVHVSLESAIFDMLHIRIEVLVVNSRRHNDDIFLIFSRKQDLIFNANCLQLMQIVSICMKRQLLFSGKNKRRYFNKSRLKIIPRVPSDKLRYTMILTSLQTIHTPLQIVQIQIRGLITSRLIRIYTVCHSVIDF